MRLVQIIWRRIRQPWITVGALGAVFDDEGRVLIVEHVFHPRCPWGLPGGWMNRNEDPADTIRRELHEETGLTVTVEEILLIQRTPEVSSHLDVAMLCRAAPGPVTLSSELLAYRWCDPTDKANMPKLIAFHRQVIKAALDARAKRNPELSKQPVIADEVFAYHAPNNEAY